MEPSIDSHSQPLLGDKQKDSNVSEAASLNSFPGNGLTQSPTEKQPCRTLLSKALDVAGGFFGGQSLTHIMDMIHHHEAPNVADPIAFGGYALVMAVIASLIESKRTGCSNTLPEQVIPVLRMIALAGFMYALIQVGIDDWDDISSSPDIPSNTTNSSLAL